jgi:hypothetical protein
MQISQHVVATHTTRFVVKRPNGKTYRVAFDGGGKAYVSVQRAASVRALDAWVPLRDGPTLRAVAFAAASAAADSPPPGGPAANLWAGVAARYA